MAPKKRTHHPSEAAGIFCFCRKGESGKMVFVTILPPSMVVVPFSCVNFKSTPEGAWFCPDCKINSVLTPFIIIIIIIIKIMHMLMLIISCSSSSPL